MYLWLIKVFITFIHASDICTQDCLLWNCMFDLYAPSLLLTNSKAKQTNKLNYQNESIFFITEKPGEVLL